MIIPWIQLGLLLFLISGGIGAALGRPKGLLIDGIVYGCLLGPFGWIIVLLKDSTPEALVRREREIEQARHPMEHRQPTTATPQRPRPNPVWDDVPLGQLPEPFADRTNRDVTRSRSK